ncbi:HK97-gp10 family putative phage morphogenesis protein [Ornithinibacillus sp. JPR2-1]|uniref:HK97-gp10 family putative phage morphogenesis protein n=1 Tax=Ornithinibacillus sp. JPR2-1 TaxID=2094019 RepID=UPI0031DA4BE2
MAKGILQFKGVVELADKLKRNASLNDVKNVIKMNGSEMQRSMVRKASFVKGYQTGTTKRSIKLIIKDNGFTAHVAPGTHYSYFLEKGTRYMDAQPFVGPAYYPQKEKFKRDMKRLMK